MIVLIATQKPFSKEAVARIRQIIESAGHELRVLEKYADEKALLVAVKDIDALIVRSDLVTTKVVTTAKKLKIVVRAGAGYDNVDLAACSKRGIVVMNTPGQNSNAVAELAIGLMIYSARNLYQPGTGTELRGRSLGLQAFGHVGKRVASHANGLGMKVYAYDPYVGNEIMREYDVEPVARLEELYQLSDYLSLHIPALPGTIASVGYEIISKLPQGATLLNTARKEIIDEPGLHKALAERPDLFYVADVMPDTYEELLVTFPGRVYATPKKMGAETAEANAGAGSAAAEQIVAFFTTGNTKFQVNN